VWAPQVSARSATSSSFCAPAACLPNALHACWPAGLQELHPEWVDRYMASTPAGAERSWVALERHCSQLPGWTRYVSRNPHVRAFSSQSICFMVSLTVQWVGAGSLHAARGRWGAVPARCGACPARPGRPPPLCTPPASTDCRCL